MKILFVSSECAPFAKAGGLGDVVGALPKALAALGHDVRVVLPRYGSIDAAPHQRHLKPLGVPMGDGEAWCGILEGRLPSSQVPIYFLEHDALWGGTAIYDGYGGDLHSMARFALLSRGGLQLCRYLAWAPDVVHVHDWPTGWVPVLLNTVERRAPFLETASVLTIHNIAYQPRFPPSGLPMLSLPESVFVADGLEDHGELNPLKGGLFHAQMLTAVSPTYAKEIRTIDGGAGLAPVTNYRGADLVGILNGIDDDIWDPTNDPYLPAHYSADNLSGKKICKATLQAELGLAVRPDIPLVGLVSRMTHQKGIDVVAKVIDPLLDLGIQIAILGSGEPEMQKYLLRRSMYGDGRFCAWIGYNEGLAHRIEAGADLFLMPSRFEPCGLNQLYSQRYGTLPIVRATGGLEDTVENYDPTTGDGTGFKLQTLTETSLIQVVAQAVETYRYNPEHFRGMQVRGMRKRMGWDLAAREYLDVYRWAQERRLAGH